jgi:hypothetical protein
MKLLSSLDSIARQTRKRPILSRNISFHFFSCYLTQLLRNTNRFKNNLKTTFKVQLFTDDRRQESYCDLLMEITALNIRPSIYSVLCQNV